MCTVLRAFLETRNSKLLPTFPQPSTGKATPPQLLHRCALDSACGHSNPSGKVSRTREWDVWNAQRRRRKVAAEFLSDAETHHRESARASKPRPSGPCGSWTSHYDAAGAAGAGRYSFLDPRTPPAGRPRRVSAPPLPGPRRRRSWWRDGSASAPARAVHSHPGGRPRRAAPAPRSPCRRVR